MRLIGSTINPAFNHPEWKSITMVLINQEILNTQQTYKLQLKLFIQLFNDPLPVSIQNAFASMQ